MSNNNELMNTEVEEILDNEATYEEETEEKSSVAGKIVFGLGAAVVAGATALAIKNRDKIKAKRTERQIKKLEAKGYVVVDVNDDDESEDIEEETTESEEVTE